MKYEYKNGVIVLPDGSKEPVAYDYRMEFDAENIFYALTAPRGWEWFNSVRSEERFKKYIEKAREIANQS